MSIPSARAWRTRVPEIHFLDVTNRDGVQTARTGLSKFGKTMINFYLGQLGVAQSEMGFPFLFHEVPYIRANVALAEAGAFGSLRLSGWCRAVPGDVERAVPLGLRHYNLSISTSDQMLAHKFRGKLDRGTVISEMLAAVSAGPKTSYPPPQYVIEAICCASHMPVAQ
jgi:isopropylmalate/homocitrate/citramalate synthase